MKRNLFRNIPTRVFDAFGDVAPACTYHQRTKQPYTPGTKHADSFVDFPTRAMKYGFSTFERSTDNAGVIKSSDYKLGIAGDELSVKPDVNDQVTFEGVRVRVERILTEDPYDAFHILHVRPV